nr:hypothetical protein [uncultured Moellerella sp.]
MRTLIFSLLLIPLLSLANHSQNPFCNLFSESTIAKIANVESHNKKDDIDLKNEVINKSRGCSKHRLFSPIRIYWPEMKALDSFKEVQKSKVMSTLIISAKTVKIEDLDMKKIRDSYLSKNSNKEITPIKHNKNLDLFYVIVARIPEKYVLVHYWPEIDNQVPLLINCVWNQSYQSYMMCNILFSIPQISAIIDISFQQGQLSQWKEMAKKIKHYILTNVIKEI